VPSCQGGVPTGRHRIVVRFSSGGTNLGEFPGRPRRKNAWRSPRWPCSECVTAGSRSSGSIRMF